MHFRFLLHLILSGTLVLVLPLFSVFSQENETAEDLDEIFLQENQVISDSNLYIRWKLSTLQQFGDRKNLSADIKRQGAAAGVPEERSGLADHRYDASVTAEYTRGNFITKLDASLIYSPPGTGYESSRSSAVDVRELSAGGGDRWQWHAGIVRRNWGSADFFRAVNYTDAMDTRDFLVAAPESFYRGTPSADVKYISGNYATELVLLPVHSPDLLPPENSYWDTDPAPMDLYYVSSRDLLPEGLQQASGVVIPELIVAPLNDRGKTCRAVRLAARTGQLPSTPPLACQVIPATSDIKQLPVRKPNAGFAIRTGGSNSGIDWHIQGYDGPSSAPWSYLKSGASRANDGEYPWFALEQGYDRERKLGFDIQARAGNGTVRAEISKTFDRPGTHVDSWGFFRKKDSPLISYVIGGDISFNRDRGHLLLEWSDQYRSRPGFIEDTLSDVLILGFQYTLLQGDLELSWIEMVRPVQSSPAHISRLSLKYALVSDRLSVETGLLYIESLNDPLLSEYDSKDTLFISFQLLL